MDGRGRTQEKSEVSLKKQHNFAYFFPRSAPSLLARTARFSEILRGYWQPCITPNCIPSRRPASFWAAFHGTRSTSCSDRESWRVSSSAAAGSSPPRRSRSSSPGRRPASAPHEPQPDRAGSAKVLSPFPYRRPLAVAGSGHTIEALARADTRNRYELPRHPGNTAVDYRPRLGGGEGALRNPGSRGRHIRVEACVDGDSGICG